MVVVFMSVLLLQEAIRAVWMQATVKSTITWSIMATAAVFIQNMLMSTSMMVPNFTTIISMVKEQAFVLLPEPITHKMVGLLETTKLMEMEEDFMLQEAM